MKSTFVAAALAPAAILLLGTLPATAMAGEAQQADPVATAAQVQPASSEDPNRMVCRRLPVIGSISRVKVCKTASQWAAEAGQVDARNGEVLQSTRAGVQVPGAPR